MLVCAYTFQLFAYIRTCTAGAIALGDELHALSDTESYDAAVGQSSTTDANGDDSTISFNGDNEKIELCVVRCCIVRHAFVLAAN